MNQSEKIRTAIQNHGSDCSNDEIREFCKRNYDFEPSNSLIYRVAGNQTERKLNNISGKQLADMKKVCHRTFNGDFDAMLSGAIAVRNYARQTESTAS